MDGQRFGTAVRAVRRRRGWSQQELAARSGTSQSAVSRVELGHIARMPLDDVRAIANALDIRVQVLARWRGGDLDRMLNAGHSQLHESVARWFRAKLPAWELAPEVTFAIYADRGVIDILAWHPGRRALLIIELKTQIVDANELMGTLDRKKRVARQIARKRGWDPLNVSTWLIVADTRTNRRRVEAHEAMLGNALPNNVTEIRRWLRDPVGHTNGLSFWSAMSSERNTRRVG